MKFILFFTIFILINTEVQIEQRLGLACDLKNMTVVCGENLICANNQGNVSITKGTCQYCTTSEQCWKTSYVLDCKASINSQNKPVFICQHKDLFPRLSWFDFGATIVL